MRRRTWIDPHSESRRPGLVLLLLALASASCADGGSGPTETTPAPVITITGVADGQTYEGAVTISITIDRGTYSATLDGKPFASGGAVSGPGEHLLSVTAFNGLASAAKEVRFTIQAPSGGILIVRMLNLGSNGAGGGGDAILVTDSSSVGMVHALIDAGPAGADASDPGYVARRLRQIGVDTLSIMLLTHAHSDHFQGMTDVFGQIHVRDFFYNGQQRNLSFYTSLLTLAHQRAERVIIPSDTVAVAFGQTAVQGRFTIVPPLPTYITRSNASSAEINEGSLGTRLIRGNFEMFFTGDGEVAANHRWRTQFATLTHDIDVLKVGHHGANNAIFDDGSGFSNTASAWLEHTSPSIALISANGVTHPRVRALAKLRQRTNTATYCTSVHGEITLRIWSDGSIHVAVEKNADADCVPGSTATS